MVYNPRILLTKGNSYRITIPKDIIEKELRWKQGDWLRLGLEKDKIILWKDEQAPVTKKNK